jgi:antitoxin ParD1/3/4
MSHDSSAVTMNVSLPEPLKQYVSGKVSSGAYGSASEFVREAIREKFERDQATAALTGQLLEGLDSGRPIRVTDGYFKAKKRAFIRRGSKKKTA